MNIFVVLGLSCLSIAESFQWAVDSWQQKNRYQMPDYPDPQSLQDVKNHLKNQSPLVFAGETDRLKDHLAKASIGESFVLIGGDCAETFHDFSVDKIKNDFHLLLEMSLVLMYGAGRPLIQIGRMAGQFAKPRSSNVEKRGDVILPAYRGDIINSYGFSARERTVDPNNMITAYHQSTQTLNLIRAFIQGGYANIYNMHLWTTKDAYREFRKQMEDALYFLKAVGIDRHHPHMDLQNLYIGHECLLLDYEECLTRVDSISQRYYDCSSHFLWLGERTRRIDSSQVEFLRGVSNPIGIKVSAHTNIDELLQIIELLNPDNDYGRITLITRMGAGRVRDFLPRLIGRIQREQKNVLWVCDPMHGNTIVHQNLKTRCMDSIKEELEAFFRIHKEAGSVAGGIHLEMTHKPVTECCDSQTDDDDLSRFYDTKCDPRLNWKQSLDVAYFVSALLQQQRHEFSGL